MAARATIHRSLNHLHHATTNRCRDWPLKSPTENFNLHPNCFQSVNTNNRCYHQGNRDQETRSLKKHDWDEQTHSGKIASTIRESGISSTIWWSQHPWTEPRPVGSSKVQRASSLKIQLALSELWLSIQQLSRNWKWSRLFQNIENRAANNETERLEIHRKISLAPLLPSQKANRSQIVDHDQWVSMVETRLEINRRRWDNLRVIICKRGWSLQDMPGVHSPPRWLSMTPIFPKRSKKGSRNRYFFSRKCHTLTSGHRISQQVSTHSNNAA